MVDKGLHEHHLVPALAADDVGDIGGAGEISPEFLGSQASLAVAAADDQVVNLLHVRRTEKAGEILRRKTRRGLAGPHEVLVGAKGVAGSPVRGPGVPVRVDEQSVIVEQSVGGGDLAHLRAVPHLKVVIALAGRCGSNIKLAENFQVGTKLPAFGQRRASLAGRRWFACLANTPGNGCNGNQPGEQFGKTVHRPTGSEWLKLTSTPDAGNWRQYARGSPKSYSWRPRGFPRLASARFGSGADRRKRG